MAVGFMTLVTCRLTAKNRDQLWNPTLGNRAWSTLTFVQCSVDWLMADDVGLRREVEVKSYNFRQFVLAYGPAKCYTV